MTRLLFAALFFVFVACSGNTKQSTSQENVSTAVSEAKKYACPMKCEGEKTYAEAGKCPVCKMDLEEVALVETDSIPHAH